MKNKNQWCLSNQLNKQVKSIQTWLNKSRCIELTLQVKFPVAYWALIPKDFSAVQKHISTYIRNTYTHRTRKNFKHVLVSRSYISYIFLLFLVGNIWNKNTYTKMKFCLLLCVLLHISLESVYGKNSSYIFFYYYFFYLPICFLVFFSRFLSMRGIKYQIMYIQFSFAFWVRRQTLYAQVKTQTQGVVIFKKKWALFYRLLHYFFLLLLSSKELVFIHICCNPYG